MTDFSLFPVRLQVLGFFSYIEDLSVFNMPPGQLNPRLPNGTFTMMLLVYEPCSDPDINNGTDRCSVPSTWTDG